MAARRMWNGRPLRRAAGVTFKMVNGQLVFVREVDGRELPVSMAGSNYGFTLRGRMLVALDGKVYAGKAVK